MVSVFFDAVGHREVRHVGEFLAEAAPKVGCVPGEANRDQRPSLIVDDQKRGRRLGRKVTDLQLEIALRAATNEKADECFRDKRGAAQIVGATAANHVVFLGRAVVQHMKAVVTAPHDNGVGAGGNVRIH